ncbi:hypothetical protein E2C01_053790 [Portunus trituberculatus]|uniref:Uncharacterized protein n=1 Tax=Portunus trituberculatus TaxID=210409 RepID=A0A5B7GL99_PORTR|nr:hypothetical protein [Portunus trituberculatus]
MPTQWTRLSTPAKNPDQYLEGSGLHAFFFSDADLQPDPPITPRAIIPSPTLLPIPNSLQSPIAYAILASVTCVLYGLYPLLTLPPPPQVF